MMPNEWDKFASKKCVYIRHGQKVQILYDFFHNFIIRISHPLPPPCHLKFGPFKEILESLSLGNFLIAFMSPK